MPVPGFRNHHHHRVREAASAHDEHLERVVEDSRIASGFVQHRQQVLDVVAVDLRLELPLARFHPVDVAAQGVDFAVMGDVTEGMGQRPAWKRVGAETLVHHREGGFYLRIHQVRKICVDLIRRQHALVNKGVARHARQVEIVAVGDARGGDRILRAAADQVEPALEIFTVCKRRPHADQDLAEHGLDGLCGIADFGVVCRHIAPTEDFLPPPCDGVFQELLTAVAGLCIARQEHHPDTILTDFRQRYSELFCLRTQESIRNLHGDAGAIARIHLTALGTPMLKIHQHLDRFSDNCV